MARTPSPSTHPTHAALVALGVRWARRQGFSVAHGELGTQSTREIPDVVAFNARCSLVIECKTSRSDFLVDSKKPWRQPGNGVGHYRFYLAPEGLLQATELPQTPRWGLIEVGARRRMNLVAGPMNGKSNLWPGNPSRLPLDDGANPDGWAAFWHPSDVRLERGLLYSIARRLS